jgi:hypothetical protein
LWKAQNPPYKYSIGDYGTAMVAIPLQIAYDFVKKSAMAGSWSPFNNTVLY